MQHITKEEFDNLDDDAALVDDGGKEYFDSLDGAYAFVEANDGNFEEMSKSTLIYLTKEGYEEIEQSNFDISPSQLDRDKIAWEMNIEELVATFL